MNEQLKDFKKCPVCGVKGSECTVYIEHGWHEESGFIKCENENSQRVMTQEEVHYWMEQDGFVVR